MIYKFYQQRVFPHLLNQIMQIPSFMDKRRELLLAVEGEVLEIGFGTGINLPFYQAVDTVYALEPNADVFHLAAQRIAEAPFRVQHLQARAERIPLADHSLSNVVSTWTLCSVADVHQVITEIHRVLKVGGIFHLVEHVAYDKQEHPKLKIMQDLLTPVQKVIADGCHLNRDIENELKKAGFKVLELQYDDADELPKVARRLLFARVEKIQ